MDWARIEKSPSYQSASEDEKAKVRAQWEKDYDSPSDDRQEIISQNVSEKGNFRRGFESGIDSTTGTLYGAAALTGDALKLNKLRDWGYEGYKRKMAEAELNPVDVPEFTDIDGLSDLGKWTSGTIGQVIPTLTEAGIAAALGGGAAGLVAKKAAKEAIEASIKKQVAKGVSKEVARKNAIAEATNTAKRVGTQAGLTGGIAAMEGGGMYGEDADKHGIEDANPLSAGALGLASGLSELYSPMGALITRILGVTRFGSKAANEVAESFIKRLRKDVPRGMAGEFEQEAFQEFLGKLNEKINDPSVSLTDKEAIKDYFNSGMAGAVAGAGFGVGHAAVPNRNSGAPTEQITAEQEVPTDPIKKSIAKVYGVEKESETPTETPIQEELPAQQVQEEIEPQIQEQPAEETEIPIPKEMKIRDVEDEYGHAVAQEVRKARKKKRDITLEEAIEQARITQTKPEDVGKLEATERKKNKLNMRDSQTLKYLRDKGKPSRMVDRKMNEGLKKSLSNLEEKGLVIKHDNGTFEAVELGGVPFNKRRGNEPEEAVESIPEEPGVVEPGIQEAGRAEQPTVEIKPPVVDPQPVETEVGQAEADISITEEEADTLDFLSRINRRIEPNEKNKPIYDSLVSKGLVETNGKSYQVINEKERSEDIKAQDDTILQDDAGARPEEGQKGQELSESVETTITPENVQTKKESDDSLRRRDPLLQNADPVQSSDNRPDGLEQEGQGKDKEAQEGAVKGKGEVEGVEKQTNVAKETPPVIPESPEAIKPLADAPESGTGDALVKSPDGSEVFGKIEASIAKEMRREAGEIRLKVGDKRSGYEHIRERHGREFKKAGYKNVVDFIHEVSQNYNEIYKGNAGTLLLVRRNGDKKVAYVKLEPVNGGASYFVKSATFAPNRYLRNKELLWKIAPESNATNVSSTPNALTDDDKSPSLSGQSNSDTSTNTITPKEGEGKTPKFSKSQPIQTPSDIEAELRPKLREIIANQLKSGEVAIIDSQQDIPKEYRTSREGQSIAGFTTPEGKVYLVRDGIEKGQAWNVYLHEKAVHANQLGLREDVFSFLESEIPKWQDRKGRDGEAIRAAIKAVPEDTAPEHVNAEILAYAIQNHSKTGLVRRAIARVKQFLITHFGKAWVDRLKVADLRAIAEMSVKVKPVAKKDTQPTEARYSITSTEDQAIVDVAGTWFTGVGNDPDLRSKIKAGAPVTLEREPDNQHDPDAIKVLIDGKSIGYVSRIKAPQLSDLLDDKVKLAATIRGVYNEKSDSPKVTVSIIPSGQLNEMQQLSWDAAKRPESQKRKGYFQELREKATVENTEDFGEDIEAAAKAVLTSSGEGQGLIKRLKKFASGIKQDKLNHLFSVLTLQQLSDIYGRDFTPVDKFRTAAKGISAMTNEMLQEADRVHQKWTGLNKQVAADMADVMFKATTIGFDPDNYTSADLEAKRDELAEKRKALQEAKRSKLLPNQKAKTIKRLMGEVAEARKEVNAANQLIPMFKKLPPEAKEIYREVRDLYQARFEQLQEVLIEQIEKTTTGKSRKQTIAQLKLRFDKQKESGPYFPLSRFGDHVVVVKKLDSEGVVVDRMVRTFERFNNAEEFAEGMRKKDFEVTLRRSKEYKKGQEPPVGFASEVLNIVNKADMSTAERNIIYDEINQAMIKLLPDVSHRKHFAHRKGVKGYSQDAQRAFASHMLHAAKHISKVKYGADLNKAIESMEKGQFSHDEKSANTEGALRNELAKRYENIMNPNVHPAAQVLTSFGFAWNIGPSLASATINLTQTPLVAYPIMASKYGWGKSAKALNRALKEYTKGDKSWESGISLEDAKFLTKKEREMFSVLVKDGTIDVSQAHDLAAASATDYLSLSEKGGNLHRYAKVMKVVSAPFHYAEVANRQITALAAYRLALPKVGHEKAIEQAKDVVEGGHFDYGQENRARIMQGNLSRVVFLFKQFSHNMTYRIARNFYLLAKKHDITEEEKRQARVQLAGILGGHFLVTGALGMPVIGMVGTALGAIAGSDDEPWDYKTELRNFLADTVGKKGAEMIAHGAARGLMPADIAGRLSLSDLWWRGDDRELGGRELFNHYMMNILGPTAANASSMFVGAHSMAEGDIWKGTEMMLPKFLKDIGKAMRYSHEGITNRQRDILMDDLENMELVSQALGFTPARVAEMYEGKRSVKNIERRLQNRRTRLKNTYIKAWEKKDNKGMQRAFRAIHKWNTAHRGTDALQIDRADLKRSIKRRMGYRNQTDKGIYLPKSRDYLREYGRFANI